MIPSESSGLMPGTAGASGTAGTEGTVGTGQGSLKAEGDTRLLKSVFIFSLLSGEELGSILPFLKVRSLPSNRILFREGETGEDLFIIRKGKVEISIRLPDGSQRRLRDFGPGDFFGEMAIFEEPTRSATARTTGPVEFYSMSRQDFFSIMSSRPRAAIKIMYRMSTIATERLHSTSEFLEEMVLWGEEARKRAVTDGLTQAYNRQFLEDSMERLFNEAAGKGRPLGLLMIDLDHFREINEKYGQDAGDLVLKAAAGVFNSCIRKGDIVARYGGDEFTILLPGADIARCSGVAQNIREGIALLSLAELLGRDTAPGEGVTTSQGLAVYPDHADGVQDLRERADRALYRSKEEGRNRVSVAEA
jgi:diguanylate cyclase (GGDEF)-like protein